MSSSERDRKDLASVVETLLSSAGRRAAAAVPPEPAARPDAPLPDCQEAPGDETSDDPPRLEVITAVACGEPAAAPLFLLAVAALPSPAPRTMALNAAGGEVGWLRTLPDEHSRFEDLERSGGRVVVLLPPRDAPEVRALAFAAARHLVWLGSGSAGLDQAREFLRALHFSCDGGRVGWLGAPALDPAPARTVFEDWAAQAEGRSAAPLGTWQPGQPLPSAVCGFFGAAPQASLRPLSWAFEVLRRASPRSPSSSAAG